MDDSHLYTIGWIAPMPLEHTAAMAAMDEIYTNMSDNDGFVYSRGRIGSHYIVVAVQAKIGTNSAADLARRISQAFRNVDRFLVVGIAGGVPSYGPAGNARQIVLGDVVVSSPWGNHGGTVKILAGRLIQEDFDPSQNVFQIISHTNAAPDDMLTAVNTLRSAHARTPGIQIPLILGEIRSTIKVQEQHTYEDPGADMDWLFDADYIHPGQNSNEDCRVVCERSRAIKRIVRGQHALRNKDTPEIHYGNIGSSNALQMNARKRDRLRDEHGILAYEMEGVGVSEAHHCLVIRGICDYSDSHKNKVGYRRLLHSVFFVHHGVLFHLRQIC
jgi:nucleoside phosphorylase